METARLCNFIKTGSISFLPHYARELKNHFDAVNLNPGELAPKLMLYDLSGPIKTRLFQPVETYFFPKKTQQAKSMISSAYEAPFEVPKNFWSHPQNPTFFQILIFHFFTFFFLLSVSVFVIVLFRPVSASSKYLNRKKDILNGP